MSGRNVRRLPRCLRVSCLTPSCFPSARNTLFHINRTSQYHIIPKCEQVQGAEAQLRKQFHTENLLIFGGAATFWKDLIYLVCVQSLKLGFRFLESYSKTTPTTFGRGFRVLQFAWLCSLLHSIGTYLRDCPEAATAERARPIRLSLADWFRTSEPFVQTCRCAGDV